jgi:hypothetical protein
MTNTAPRTGSVRKPAPPSKEADRRAHDDALRAQDSPKPHGDELIDAINPLRHVAKDLT